MDRTGSVPNYATSIEGSHGVPLHPKYDENGQFLAVFDERFGYTTAGGAVDVSEGKLKALSREWSEEIGLKVNPEKPVYFLFGYQKTHARENVLNDNVSYFAARADKEDFDSKNMGEGKEVRSAEWMSVEDVVKAYLAERAARNLGNGDSAERP